MKKTVASLTMSLAFIVGCSNQVVSESKIMESEQKQVTQAQTTTQNIQSYFSTEFFKIGVPENWKVVSYEGPEIPTYVSVEKKESNTVVTISVKHTKDTIDDLCQKIVKKLIGESKDIIAGPVVEFGTCKIVAVDQNDNKSSAWIRKYDDDNTEYSIYFEGSQEEANEVLTTLQGNEKIMSLLIMPVGAEL